MLTLAFTASPALAWDDAESMSVALELGSVLSAEGPCGLSFDQAAIGAWIEKTVPADDMGFASNLSMMTTGSGVQIDTMSASARTAHCAQITRVARANGFIE